MRSATEQYARRFWSRKGYYLKLEWLHPFWLRAIVALLIAAPLFVMFVLGTAAVVLLVPLILLVKFFGFSIALILWIGLYIFAFYMYRRWNRQYQKQRPRRPVRRTSTH